MTILRARRLLQVALGLVWLLDAALQFQPFMFGRGFAREVLRPTADGNPWVVARPVLWSAHVVLSQPQLWNTIFALTQLGLALGLFWRRSVKVALAGTVAWSLIVWWLGEGLGGVLAGSATPLMGAPGAVILYALLALVLWPRDDAAGASLADTGLLSRFAPIAWLLVWSSEAYFALLPANDSSAALHGMLGGMADGEPRPIAGLDRLLARVVAHQSAVGPALGALFAVCALAVLVPRRLGKPLYGLAMALAAVTWLGQDFGGIFTGQGTDPNSGPLLFLLAVAYWPFRQPPVATPVIAVGRLRPTLRRTAPAVAAAALVATSSVAAATGLTTHTTTSGRQVPLTASSPLIHGPGPLVSSYRLGRFHVMFGDPVNRATHPGRVSVSLRSRGRPIDDARVSVTYRPLDMEMPAQSIRLTLRGQGRYSRQGPDLAMGGRWRITISVSPRHGSALRISLTDLIGR